MRKRGEWAYLLIGALWFSGLSACRKAPAEPEGNEKNAASSEPIVKPLQWQAPGTWTVVLEGTRTGVQKSGYKIPPAGADKEEAQLQVLFYGTGSEGDAEKRITEFLSDFDGNAVQNAKRESFEVKEFKIEQIEAAGTFKIAMGPKVGPKKKAPMQMVKENFRIVIAVVKTKDRGNWFFKMVGPDETVQASKAAFRSLLESVQ